MTFLQCLFVIWSAFPFMKPKPFVVEFTKAQKCKAGAWNFFGPGHYPQMYESGACLAYGETIFPMSNYGWREGEREPGWRVIQRENAAWFAEQDRKLNATHRVCDNELGYVERTWDCSAVRLLIRHGYAEVCGNENDKNTCGWVKKARRKP